MAKLLSESINIMCIKKTLPGVITYGLPVYNIGQSIQLGENVEPNEYPHAFILALLNPKSSNVFACASKTSPAVFPGTKVFTQLFKALNNCVKTLVPGKTAGEVFDAHAKTFDDLGFNKARMNACGYSLGSTFSPNWMDWPMLYTGNPYVITPGNVFFMHMILMDSDSNLAMNLGETYLVTENGNERLGKQKLDLVVL